ncbi:hypothetical protein ASF71_20835 [Deinococcus sp. Leaf326]|nr:hypothetical protein ASF71_20835 [Deinococcus sp. Leaf326]
MSILAERNEDWVEVRVIDNGIGIDAAHFEKIFTVFQRLHRRDEYAGNGIGLAIVRKIMQRHGGSVEVNSVVDEGTTFTLKLPSESYRENNNF